MPSKTTLVLGPAAVLGLLGLGALGLAGCSSAQAATAAPAPVAPAPPPKDDGKSAKADGQEGGAKHSAALEQLAVAPMGRATDRQASIVFPLPDAEHWTRVKFQTVKSLVGFRYGKAHHAIVGAFVTKVDDNEKQGACAASFESWAMPMVEAFEVELSHDAPQSFPWTLPASRGPFKVGARAPEKISIVGIDSLHAKTATLLSRGSYVAAWAAYPAWEKACLIVGVAIPERDDARRAKAVRDRFVADVLPKLVVTTTTEPPERF